MEIRPLRESDLDAFVDELWLPLAEEMAEFHPFNEPAETVREPTIDHRLERLETDGKVDYVATQDGELAGYVAVAVRESPPVFTHDDVLHVGSLYVRPEFRRDGYATALLDRAQAWGVGRGCGYVDLSVIRENEAAKELYRSRGYEIRKHEMRKSLE